MVRFHAGSCTPNGTSVGKPVDFDFDLEVQFAGEKASSLAFIKKNADAPLEDVKLHSLSSQLHLVNLGEGSPFEILHAYIRNSFGPFLRSYTKDSSKRTGAAERETSASSSKLGAGLMNINQKLTELELSLLNIKQNVQIEEVVLEFHPEIVDASRKV
jgi:dynein heavy chain 1